MIEAAVARARRHGRLHCSWPARGTDRTAAAFAPDFQRSGERSMLPPSRHVMPDAWARRNGEDQAVPWGTGAPQRVARRPALRRRDVGAGPGHRPAGARARVAGGGDALVHGRSRHRLSILDCVRLVLRIHARRPEARERGRARRIHRAHDRAQARFRDHRRARGRRRAAADRSRRASARCQRDTREVDRGAAVREPERRQRAASTSWPGCRARS